MTELERYKQALLRIKDECGLVCEDFDICEHKECNSSCLAWMIAADALQVPQISHNPTVTFDLDHRNYSVICSCGWQDYPWYTEYFAQVAADRHLEDVREGLA